MSELRAGLARVTITPPIGIGLVGFQGRGPSEGIHDDLLATALALESGGSRAIVFALDLIGVGDHLVERVTEEVRKRTGAGAVLLCTSHTHYGPPTGAYEATDHPEDVAAYVANLTFLLAGAAQAAVSRLEPVRMGFGRGASTIGINRRELLPDGEIILGHNPGGACDREVQVLRLDTLAGQPLAVLVGFPCHGVSAAGGMREISADFIGVMRQLVESNTGATCLFFQGATGNINPVEMRHSFEPARRLGVMFGGEVAKVFEDLTTEPAEGLSAASTHVDLPAMTFNSLEEGEGTVALLEAEVSRRQGETGGAIIWAQSRLREARERCESMRTGVPLPSIPAELHAIRFGAAALVTSPGEIFNEIGVAIRQASTIPNTIFAGYTNGSIGYVPVPEAYAEGGYEVTHACRVSPAAAGMIQNTALALLREVTNTPNGACPKSG